MFRIGPTLEEQPLIPILIIPKVPPAPEHPFPADILGEPELEDYRQDDQLCSIMLFESEDHDLVKYE